MNNKRREKLRKAIELVERATEIIETCQDEEQDSMDSIPEALQLSERYESMEDAYGALDRARDYCAFVTDFIEIAIH